MRAFPMFFLALTALQAGSPGPAPAASPGVSVDSIDLVSVGSDEIVLRVQSHVISARKVTVKRVEFRDMEAEGLPLNVNPILDRLTLPANQPIGLQPLAVSLKTNSIRSVGPLISATSRGQIRVSGRARMDLELTFFERFFAGYPDGKADIAIRGEIPFEVPGGAAGRAAMVLALRALELAMATASSVLR